jgi:hypothetical protein
MESVAIRFQNVERIDAYNLKAKEPSVEIVEIEEGTDLAQYEPGTVIVMIAMAALGVAAAWLLKNRKTTEIDEELTVIKSDGTMVKKNIHFKVDQSLATDQSVAALTEYMKRSLSD